MDFDLIIIGTGMAAQAAAIAVRKADWSVAIVDEKPFGGTCPLRGCDPKKMLVAGVEVIDAARRMRGNGVEGAVQVAWKDLIAFKRSFTDPIPAKTEERFSDQGISTFHGTARFTSPRNLMVDGTTLGGRHFLIASGAHPVRLGIPGEQHLIDNETFMAMEMLPRRIALVGGGYIAAEFSHIAARAGAEVTVLQRANRMLTRFEPELVGWLMAHSAQLGSTCGRRRLSKALRRRTTCMSSKLRASEALVGLKPTSWSMPQVADPHWTG